MKQLTLEQVETLLLIVTEHNRTSCSDSDLSNTYKHYDDGVSRCARCSLLYASQTGWTPKANIEIQVEGH